MKKQLVMMAAALALLGNGGFRRLAKNYMEKFIISKKN